jgi:YesN/AraC family two-component response regulator
MLILADPDFMIKALIVDDETGARRWIRRILQNETDIEIVGECASGGGNNDRLDIWLTAMDLVMSGGCFGIRQTERR